MEENGENNPKPPEVQIPGAGSGGKVPPVAHRWKKGQSGNPAGRKAAGAYPLEEMASLYADGVLEDDLRKIVKDKLERPARRQAALRILRSIEISDLADFEEYLGGNTSLGALRAGGVPTDLIKKITPTKDGVAIELRDRSGEEFDRILDRTVAKPVSADLQERLDELHRAVFGEKDKTLPQLPPENDD